jgi:DNA-binding transcriptional MerR regulator
MNDREKPYTARHAKELAGLSYRQLNDWEQRGALPGEDDRDGEGWRRFSPSEMFALMVCGELKREYGIPLEKLKFILESLSGSGGTHLRRAIWLVEQGVSTLLITDMTKTLMVESDLEVEDLVFSEFFRGNDFKHSLILRLNGLVESFIPLLENHESRSRDDSVYRLKAEVDSALRVHTVAEFELLQAIRNGHFDKITVTIKNRMILEMDAKGFVASDKVHEDDHQVHVPVENTFETLTISRHNGRIVRARRKIPRKYSERENRPAVFAIRSNA